MNTPTGSKPAASLAALHAVELSPAYRAIFDQVAPGCAGPEPWRRRKLGAAHELLALAQVSGRLVIHYLDLTVALRAVFRMTVPVPCRRGGRGPLVVAPAAQLGLVYRQEAMLTAQNGLSFFEILEPRDVFHANVATSHWPPDAQVGAPSHSAPRAQMLCLGSQLFPGIKLVDLVLMAYGALSLQTTQFSLADPAGVLNPEAARWFQANATHIPLTREPFRLNKEVTL